MPHAVAHQLASTALAKHRLDAIVAPTRSPLAWPIDYANGDHANGCTQVPAVVGIRTSPCRGLGPSGLPVGVSFFAGAYSEPTLLRLAYAYEQATKARKPPRVLPRSSRVGVD